MKRNYLLILFMYILSCSFTVLYGQGKEIRGTVNDHEGQPLVGANVVIKGTTKGTVTDLNGEYKIVVPDNNAVLVFSFVGSLTEEREVGALSVIDVVLSLDLVGLEEVVVVGYGSVKKSDLTGSIASIKADDIISTSVTSLDQGLIGRAAGVVVMQTSGQPGASTSIRIRGITSLMGTNEPLYVIDGIPIISDPNATDAFASGGPALNPLASINPADIQSVEILKDASGTAIYGARGANGVILITTKRGTKNTEKINFSAYYGLQQVSRKIPMLNALELAELGNEATDNANIGRRAIYASPRNLGEGTDWQDEIFRVAPIQNYQFSYSGGSESSTYLISANYFKQDGVVIGSDFSKITLRTNIDRNLATRFKIGGGLNLTRSVSNGVITDSEGAIPLSIVSWALNMNPGLPVRNEDGSYVYQNNTSSPAIGNPVADALEVKNKATNLRFIGNAYLQYDILKSLSFKSTFGADIIQNLEQYFAPNDVKRGETGPGGVNLGNLYGLNWLWENTLNYNKTFGVHSVSAVVAYSMQAYVTEYNVSAKANFDDDRSGFYSIQTGKDLIQLLSGYSGWQMQSYLGRINYTLLDRYLLTISGRSDGSSKFGEGNKFGFFPSFALGWKVKEEQFLQSVDAISALKLRISYGITGNEGIAPYSSQSLLYPVISPFGTVAQTGYVPAQLSNDKLRWETSAQTNIGIDLGLWENKVEITADIYRKKTTDLLLLTPVPYLTGYGSAYLNVGSMENKGVEFAVTAHPMSAGVIKWTTTFNLSVPRNKVLELSGGEEGLVANPVTGISGWTRVLEGKPVGTFYGYQTNGIMQEGEDPASVPYFAGKVPEPGVRKYVNQNDDFVINEEDRVELGSASPDLTFGWSNSLNYKNWNLSIFIQGNYGNEIVNFNKFSLESFTGNNNNSTAALERWTPENRSNTYPRADYSPDVSNVLSDHQVEDGSYLRVKDITLTYHMPDKLKIPVLKGASFYISVKNFLTVTNYSGYDPELSRFANNPLTMGADFGPYPNSRSAMIGFSTNF